MLITNLPNLVEELLDVKELLLLFVFYAQTTTNINILDLLKQSGLLEYELSCLYKYIPVFFLHIRTNVLMQSHNLHSIFLCSFDDIINVP